MALLSIGTYAKRIGVSRQNVYKAIEEGHIKKGVVRNGDELRIDFEIAEKEWDRKKKPAIPPEFDPAFAASHPDEEDEDEDEAEDEGLIPLPAGVPHLHASRATREHWLAQQAQLNFQQAQGKLLDREQVRRTVFALARKARDAMIAIPERTSAILAATTDEREVLNILLREINRVCDEIARGAEAPVETVHAEAVDVGLDDI